MQVMSNSPVFPLFAQDSHVQIDNTRQARAPAKIQDTCVGAWVVRYLVRILEEKSFFSGTEQQISPD